MKNQRRRGLGFIVRNSSDWDVKCWSKNFKLSRKKKRKKAEADENTEQWGQRDHRPHLRLRFGPRAPPATPGQPRTSLYNVNYTRTRQSLHQLAMPTAPKRAQSQPDALGSRAFSLLLIVRSGSWPQASFRRAWLWMVSSVAPPCLQKNRAERANSGPESFFGTSFYDKPKRPLKLKAM